MSLSCSFPFFFSFVSPVPVLTFSFSEQQEYHNDRLGYTFARAGHIKVWNETSLLVFTSKNLNSSIKRICAVWLLGSSTVYGTYRIFVFILVFSSVHLFCVVVVDIIKNIYSVHTLGKLHACLVVEYGMVKNPAIFRSSSFPDVIGSRWVPRRSVIINTPMDSNKRLEGSVYFFFNSILDGQ